MRKVITMLTFSLVATILNAAELYDFGTESSPLASGYTRMTPLSEYSPGKSGWVNVSDLFSRERGRGDDLSRDFVTSRSPNVFTADVPPGKYTVKVVMGDNRYASDGMTLSTNGVVVASAINLARGMFKTSIFEVSQTTGRIELEFAAAKEWKVNAIEISLLEAFEVVAPPLDSAEMAPAPLQDTNDVNKSELM